MALFKTDEEWADYSSFNNTFPLKRVKSEMEDALENYIIPHLSQEQYDLLETAYLAAYADNVNLSTLSQKNKNLLHKVRAALGGFTSWLYFPNASGQMTNSGFMEVGNDQSGMRNASKWRTAEKLETLRVKAWQKLDLMLKFLEQNKADYTFWAVSDSYTEFKSCFIVGAETFHKFKNIGHSRALFFAMRDKMKRVDERALPIVHATLYASIKSQIKANTLTSANNRLLQNYIQPAVAHLTYAEALRENIVSITSNGVMVPSTQQLRDEFGNEKMGADGTVTDVAIRNSTRVGEEYLSLMKKYLDSNLDDYPDYYNDEAYVLDAPVVYENKPECKTFKF